MKRKDTNELKELRLQAKLTRKQLCNMTGTSERTYQNWELQLNNPPNVMLAYLRQYIAMRKALQIPL